MKRKSKKKKRKMKVIERKRKRRRQKGYLVGGIVVLLLFSMQALGETPFPVFDYGIGAGVPGVSIQLGTGKIRFLDSIVPAQVALNLYQRVYPKYRVAWWSIITGMSISRDEELEMRLFIIPYSIRVNDFSFGPGIAYQARGKATLAKENFFVLVPYVNARF